MQIMHMNYSTGTVPVVEPVPGRWNVTTCPPSGINAGVYLVYNHVGIAMLSGSFISQKDGNIHGQIHND